MVPSMIVTLMAIVLSSIVGSVAGWGVGNHGPANVLNALCTFFLSF